MRTSWHKAIVLAILAILAAAAVSVRAGRTEHGPVHELQRVKQTTSDPDDVPPIGGLQ
jgi:hypothetical protein